MISAELMIRIRQIAKDIMAQGDHPSANRIKTILGPGKPSIWMIDLACRSLKDQNEIPKAVNRSAINKKAYQARDPEIRARAEQVRQESRQAKANQGLKKIQSRNDRRADELVKEDRERAEKNRNDLGPTKPKGRFHRDIRRSKRILKQIRTPGWSASNRKNSKESVPSESHPEPKEGAKEIA